MTRKLMESCFVNLMLPSCIFLLYTFFFCFSLPKYCYARDTITLNDSISDGDTLVSAQETFELGFFTPNESSSEARYVGIWYYNFPQQTVVWVANRDNPLSDRNGTFGITEDGNLHVLDAVKKSDWSTKLQYSSSSNITAMLTEFGNLVLSNFTSTLWESFQDPTDTFLPGMLMNGTMQITSWKSKDDPAIGNFAFKRDEDGVGDDQFITLKRSVPYWRSGESNPFISTESNQIPVDIPSLLSNFSRNCSKETSYRRTCSVFRNIAEYSYARLVMRFTGEIEYLIGFAVTDPVWLEPRDRCRVLNACGNFGICNSNHGLMCKCLPGFEPSSLDSWNSGDFSGGCKRESPIFGKSDTFLSLMMMKVRKPDSDLRTPNETECRKECLANRDCHAYSYFVATDTSVCWIWMNYLSNLQEEFTGGRSLFVRVNVSDIEPIKRNCKTCGTNLIPYPLSTEPNCGDLMYYNFHCNYSTGQLSFKAPGGTYQVSSINPNTKKFVIQARNVKDYCDAKNSRGKFLQLDQSSQYSVDSNCTVRSNMTKSKGGDELEISWLAPPLPPICHSSRDCEDWPHSTCQGTVVGIKSFSWYPWGPW